MGIAFTKTFGGLSETSNKNNASCRQVDDRPKAEFWLNIGYSVEVADENTGEIESRFISLTTGIPLDTQEKLTINSRNQMFAAFQGARNDLLDQIMDVAKMLAPGEEKIIGEAGGLQLQVRRVNGEAPVVKLSRNPFRRPIMLVD